MRAAFVFAVSTVECYGTLHLAFISRNDRPPEYRLFASPSVGASRGELGFIQELTGQRLRNNGIGIEHESGIEVVERATRIQYCEQTLKRSYTTLERSQSVVSRWRVVYIRIYYTQYG